MTPRELTDAELIEQLRRCASVWFKNFDLLMLEELIRRFERRAPPAPPSQHDANVG
jgi:hypothetical protein